MQVTFGEKPQMKIHSLKEQIHGYLIQIYQGTVVNRTLPSFHGGSLQMTLTVPLNSDSSVLRTL